MTALRMVLRGSRASSARGAADSKPVNARMENTPAAITPEMPPYPSTVA